MCEPGDTVAMWLPSEAASGWRFRPVDRCIAPLVAALRSAGFETVGSCCGHRERSGEVLMADGSRVVLERSIGRETTLSDTASRRFYPPTESDVPMHGWSPYSDMHRERIRAHAKHDARDGSMERKDWTNPIWLPVVVEEVGEVGRVLNDAELKVLDADVAARLREELVQVGAMTAAWIDAIDLRDFTEGSAP